MKLRVRVRGRAWVRDKAGQDRQTSENMSNDQRGKIANKKTHNDKKTKFHKRKISSYFKATRNVFQGKNSLKTGRQAGVSSFSKLPQLLLPSSCKASLRPIPSMSENAYVGMEAGRQTRVWTSCWRENSIGAIVAQTKMELQTKKFAYLIESDKEHYVNMTRVVQPCKNTEIIENNYYEPMNFNKC